MFGFGKKKQHGPKVQVSEGFFVSIAATKMPTPGAMKYGFAGPYFLAPRAMIGSAIGQAVTWHMFSPQDYQNTSVVTITGLGGLAQGQIVGQPLSNPYGS
jgi:hypothetical protein